MIFAIVFQSSGYCWCVEPTSGRPVPGTSVQNSHPECGRGEEVVETDSLPEKEWKKCPDNRKKWFRDSVLRMMTEEMMSSAEVSYDPNAPISIQDRAASWKFRKMDVNKDGVISYIIIIETENY